VLPELENRGAGVVGAGIGIRCADSAGLTGGLKQAGNVVSEPAGECVVGMDGVEFGKDAFTEGCGGVSGQ
jgi:hypothetical protein